MMANPPLLRNEAGDVRWEQTWAIYKVVRELL
jgi:hypothetical protein